jgi:hypothetical protein
MLLMLQREAALVEEMRTAAAEFRKVSDVAAVACISIPHASFASQRFEEPLQALQAARNSFHDTGAAHLPGSVVDNLPVSSLHLPLVFAAAACQSRVTPRAAPASVCLVGARPQP